MVTVKTIDYKGYKIDVNIDKDFHYLCACAVLDIGSRNPKNTWDGTFNTPDAAIASIQQNIDEFLSHAPKDYDELAKAIESSLVWTGYEDCEVNPVTLEIIVENFIKARK